MRSLATVAFGNQQPACSTFYTDPDNAASPSYSTTSTDNCYLSNMNSTCSASLTGQRRLCCCGSSNCPTTYPPSLLGWVLEAVGESCTDSCPLGVGNTTSMSMVTTATVFDTIIADIYLVGAVPTYNGSTDPLRRK
jgi:hypothetical protein